MKRSVLLGGIAAAPFAFTGAGAPAQAAGDTLAIAGTANDSGGQLFYAKDLNLFAKAGLPGVAISALNSPGAAAAAVAGGTLTVGTLTIPGIVIAKSKGLPIVIIAPASLYNSAKPTSGIVVLQDSPLRTARDLTGKTLATRDIGNMSYYGALQWIDKNGGDSKSVKWVEIADPSDMAAMRAHRIDAASVSEPAFSDALHGGARLLADCYDAIADRFLIAAYFTTAAYARANPDVVRKISKVIIEAGVWANSHQAESAKILEKYSNAPIPPDITRVTYAEKMRAADVVPILDMMRRYNVLKGPMKPAELFAPEIQLST